MDKDRITRQSEHKGRQTNNSSLVSKQISLYSNIDNIKKRKNVLSPVKSKNSPQKSKGIQVKKKVSESNNNKSIKKNTTIVNCLNSDGLKTPPVQSITLSSIKSRFKNDQMHQSQNNSDEDDDDDDDEASSVSSSDNSKGTSTEKNEAPSPAAIEETKILKTLESDGDTSTIIHNKQINYLKTKLESALSNNPANHPFGFGEHSDAESESNQINAVIKGNVSKKKNFDNLEEQNNKKGMKDGHFNMLHTYVRDELFKKIKILSDAHLLENGQIMNKCLEQCKYNPKIHDVKFINDCRTEIRITINSRRGYVKRKIKILLQGKLHLNFGY